ncbi:uncharacterized protein LOC106082322 [Stomoxys calcitrans]|uniref:C3H1-type domain-containing protein n=1 Tax=Stomoxys calcitrans TaxID=35570 RepID=A0A1I8PBF8_STOCA|nr:uncharacterized protein LOC106082322 [Stomoxys calcitrans]
MLSLVADYSDSLSSSNSETGDSDEESKKHEQNKPPVKATTNSKPLLPSASLLLNSSQRGAAGVVFSNPFLEAEKAEIDKLQKHVQMVESEDHLIQKNGRKICWNNRKGRCRFGNKCKYAHDSDLVAGIDDDNASEVNNEESQQNPPPSINATIAKSAQLSHSSIQTYQSVESTDSKLKSRKRPGLGDSIVPGKKVIKQYQTSKTTTKTTTS